MYLNLGFIARQWQTTIIIVQRIIEISCLFEPGNHLEKNIYV